MRGSRSSRALALALACAALAGTARAEDEPGRIGGAGTSDPWEGFNRRVFWLNEKLDRMALEPVGKFWDRLLPDVVQTSIRRVYDNVRFPTIFVNNMLQGKVADAGEDIVRFTVNSTVGIGAIWDPAGKLLDLPPHDEDFGQTLGAWGVPAGPYLMLPVFGPSNVRDLVGRGADFGLNYATWFAAGIPILVNIANSGVDLVNRRSLLIKEIAAEREAAFDFYVFVRSAYSQNREQRIRDDREPEPSEQLEDDLYYWDEEAFEDGEDEAPEEPVSADLAGQGGEEPREAAFRTLP